MTEKYSFGENSKNSPKQFQKRIIDVQCLAFCPFINIAAPLILD